MNKKLIAQGAEAKIFLEDNFIIKDRIKKSYRISEIDKKIRERRTRAEAKLLTKASKVINCPVPEISKNKKETKLKIPFIDGKKLSDNLNSFSIKEQKLILKQIGKDVSKMHKEDIIHGDLTTSNMILAEHSKIKKSKSDNSMLHLGGREFREDMGKKKTNLREPIIYFIDFGLGYFNGKFEDKAVDIHLLKQALEAKHFENWKELFKEFEKGYKYVDKEMAEKVFNQLVKVEKRGRYKH